MSRLKVLHGARLTVLHGRRYVFSILSMCLDNAKNDDPIRVAGAKLNSDMSWLRSFTVFSLGSLFVLSLIAKNGKYIDLQ